jgi:hypothetical protein
MAALGLFVARFSALRGDSSQWPKMLLEFGHAIR